MSKICNNISAAHDPITISDGDTAMLVMCKNCKARYTVRKDPYKGVPEKRQYAQIFRRDILQGGDNLFYKYNPQFLHT